MCTSHGLKNRILSMIFHWYIGGGIWTKNQLILTKYQFATDKSTINHKWNYARRSRRRISKNRRKIIDKSAINSQFFCSFFFKFWNLIWRLNLNFWRFNGLDFIHVFVKVFVKAYNDQILIQWWKINLDSIQRLQSVMFF